MKTFWQGLSRGARVGLIAGATAVVAAIASAGWWLLHPDYEVLFADLKPQDAVAIAAELDRQKVSFDMDEEPGGGTTIRVAAKDVHQTRIKLMGQDIPLHGAIGFELFDNSDFGMTEFAQKINYQRALQGELTRTILSLTEIRDARVLVALPEQGLFKQATSRPKASITLTLKQGQALAPEQVTGIQRLVAAAVPGISAQDVTIVDQSGVALTRHAGDGDAEGSSPRLELKRDTESYLARKATQVLERALGAGQGLVSVDVTLDMDRVQSTLEDVVAVPGLGRAQTGVVVRERVVRRESPAPATVVTAPAGGAAGTESSQREVEYAVGRRVEQVIGQPGSITRLDVVAVVRTPLDATHLEQVRSMVAASVGASPERGDTVVVQFLPSLAAAAGDDRGVGALEKTPADAAERPRRRAPAAEPALDGRAGFAIAVVVGVLLAGIALRRGFAGRAPAGGARLSDAERQAVLAQVQGWLRGGRPGDAS